MRMPIAAPRRMPRLPLGEWWSVFALALAANLVIVWMVVFRLNIFLTDAMARTRSAWQVFYSADPKLSNIGFVWAPLPTLLQLPLVLLPPLRDRGLSANLLTAVMGAGTTAVLVWLARGQGWGWPARVLLALGFVLNPMTLFYAANGMSEMTLIFFAITATALYVRWSQTYRWIIIAGIAGATAFAVLARYDAVVFAALLGGLLLVQSVTQRLGRGAYTRAEGVTLAYAAPVVYVAVVWALVNWVIMGDPFYFARSAYSNAGQIGYQVAAIPWLLPVRGNVQMTARLTFSLIWDLYPPFLVLSALTVAVSAGRRRLVGAGLAALAWTFPLFSALNIFTGQSAVFLRYFILVIPMSFVMAAWLVGEVPHRFRQIGALGMAAVLLASGVFSARAMTAATEWGQWNDVFVRALLSNTPVETWTADREIAAFVNAQPQSDRVLMDDFQGYRVIFFSQQPRRFLATSDSEFRAALRDPFGKATFILTSTSALEGKLNQVNVAFPDLYDNGGAWVRLEKERGVWRLYRVLGPPNQIAPTNAAALLRPPVASGETP